MVEYLDVVHTIFTMCLIGKMNLESLFGKM